MKEPVKVKLCADYFFEQKRFSKIKLNAWNRWKLTKPCIKTIWGWIEETLKTAQKPIWDHEFYNMYDNESWLY